MDNLVSIILPVYNQEDHIKDIIIEYETALSKMPIKYELLLIVNGSHDDSMKICNNLEKTFKTVRSFHLEEGGWGLAVKKGLIEAQGDFLCYTNSARTSVLNLQLLILYAISNPDNVIKANRKISDNIIRRFASLSYNLECRFLFDLATWDINGTPKVFPRSFNKLFQLKRDNDLIDLEFLVTCRQSDYPIIEVPIYSSMRQGGKSTTNIKSALRLYMGAIQLCLQMVNM